MKYRLFSFLLVALGSLIALLALLVYGRYGFWPAMIPFSVGELFLIAASDFYAVASQSGLPKAT